MPFAIVIMVLGLACPFVAYFLWKKNRELKTLKTRFQGITDAEAEAWRIRDVATREAAGVRFAAARDAEVVRVQAAQEAESERLAVSAERSAAMAEIAQAKEQITMEEARIRELVEEHAALEDIVVANRVNLPTDAYAEDSDEFSKALLDVRETQKSLAKAGRAATCATVWTVAGSTSKGEAMTRRTLDLMLRAFNGECDSFMAKAKAGNEAAMMARIEKAAVAVNRLGTKQDCKIEDIFVALKIRELQLVCGRQQAIEREREEQRAIREQMRDEAVALRELEKVQRDAELEERRFEKALELAQRQLEGARDEKRILLQDQIAALQGQLAEAHAKMERAVSQAQLTRAGHVYVISNIGSFGEHVYKVGMTRRLDPQDRIDELGDASVPFRFDVHAMIHSDNAPTLEKALHDALEPHRVNKVNSKKEFFRVDLQYIQQIAEKHHGSVRITLAAEAAEFRQSLMIEDQRMSA